MTSEELTEWMGYAKLEPFGSPVDDLRAGLAPAVALNLNRKEDALPVTALAFYPWHSPPEPPPDTPEQAAEKIRALLNSKAKANGNA